MHQNVWLILPRSDQHKKHWSDTPSILERRIMTGINKEQAYNLDQAWDCTVILEWITKL